MASWSIFEGAGGSSGSFYGGNKSAPLVLNGRVWGDGDTFPCAPIQKSEGQENPYYRPRGLTGGCQAASSFAWQASQSPSGSIVGKRLLP